MTFEKGVTASKCHVGFSSCVTVTCVSLSAILSRYPEASLFFYYLEVNRRASLM